MAANTDRLASTPEAPPDVKHIRLWDGPAPEAKGEGPEHEPFLRAYYPDPSLSNGAAVIVCPGGGYNICMQDHEGRQIANWLNSLGVTAFVLTYRTKPHGYQPDVALRDGKRAVRHVRSRAKEFGVAPDRIGMIGFSAGANLILQVALTSDAGDTNATDAVERVSCRPDRLLPIYGTPLHGELDAEQRAFLHEHAADMAPTFFMLATDDARWATEGCMVLYRELYEAGVDAELHQFGGYGPHGVGLADGHPSMSYWPALAALWMRNGGFLSAKGRVVVTGAVTIDDQPMRWGWVTLTPAGAPNSPIVTVMITKEDGSFEIGPEHGPVPGTHRLEVTQNIQEVKRLEPSLKGAVRYTSVKPGGPPMEAEITDGTNNLAIDIKTGAGDE
jgi:acetyl esterase/lipase